MCVYVSTLVVYKVKSTKYFFQILMDLTAYLIWLNNAFINIKLAF